jgi:hypothetical protein
VDLVRKGHAFSVRWEVEPNRPLGISTWNTIGAVRNIRLRELAADEVRAAAKRRENEEPEEPPAKVPIIHSTDLFHPHDDPDDHYDLATLFAVKELDVRGVVLDLGAKQKQKTGLRAVQQMMHITGRKVPCAIGLGQPLRSREDKALGEDESFQGGVKLILDTLRRSDEKVVLSAVGSCRDVAAAFNREPQLCKEKLRAVYISIGDGPDGDQTEYNEGLDPQAFQRVLESGMPVYWCPCFGRDGYATFYTADQRQVVGACLPAVQNYFVYCLTESKADPIAFLSSGPHPLPTGPRNMWSTVHFLHAAGRKIYQRGPDDFVALTPYDAEKAGLGDKDVDVYQFVTMRAEGLPLPPRGKNQKPVSARLKVELNPVESRGFVFRAVDPRYGKIMPRV